MKNHYLQDYTPPFAELIPMDIEAAVCGGPSDPGRPVTNGLEDIDYDDWDTI